MKKLVLVVMFALSLGGCASMNTHEKNAYRQIEEVGAECEKVANPTTAAILNVLPGIGDIYLATGNGANSSNWGAFALDLLLWPYSIVWGIPQGAITATDINKKECVGYYNYTIKGKEKMQKLKEQYVASNRKEQPDNPVE